MRQATLDPIALPDIDVRPLPIRVATSLDPRRAPLMAAMACVVSVAMVVGGLRDSAGGATAQPPRDPGATPAGPPDRGHPLALPPQRDQPDATDEDDPVLAPAAPETRWVDVELYNQNTRELATIGLPLDGEVDSWTAERVGRFFRCWRTGRWRKLDAGLLAMLAQLADHYPGRIIEITSGFRARPYEPRSSPHRQGRAIDFRVHGVPIRTVRDYLWTHHNDVGVGYYHQQGFIHLDHRPGEDVAWTQRRKGRRYRYDPWWAVKARRQAQAEARL